MNKRVLITGSSGFIGTNLIERLLGLEYDVKGVDIRKPRNVVHNNIYENVDLKDGEALIEVLLTFRPDYVIHLAARTDLDGKEPEDYLDNTLAVKNLCNAVIECEFIKKVIFTSSMLVCRSGYIPKRNDDYCPNTEYGVSKVEGELIVKGLSKQLPDFLIIRPTSIWGPWFAAPYKNFFDLVLSKRYVRIGGKACTKTYGYVGNSVNQIITLLESKTSKNSIYYIGDQPPLNVDIWAVQISKKAGLPRPIRVPFFLLKSAAIFGDVASYLGIQFPLTSFRLGNMTTDNIFNDIPVCKINKYKVVSLDEAIMKTINWVKLNK